MSYRLFIDDERFPPRDRRPLSARLINTLRKAVGLSHETPAPWVIVRTSDEAMAAIMERGIPSFISFDHDLGGDDTAMRFLHRFADWVFDPALEDRERVSAALNGLGWYVHSQNPVGKQNIEGFMKSFYRALYDHGIH